MHYQMYLRACSKADRGSCSMAVDLVSLHLRKEVVKATAGPTSALPQPSKTRTYKFPPLAPLSCPSCEGWLSCSKGLFSASPDKPMTWPREPQHSYEGFRASHSETKKLGRILEATKGQTNHFLFVRP